MNDLFHNKELNFKSEIRNNEFEIQKFKELENN